MTTSLKMLMYFIHIKVTLILQSYLIKLLTFAGQNPIVFLRTKAQLFFVNFITGKAVNLKAPFHPAMQTQSLKDILIQRIQSINDEAFLNALKVMTDAKIEHDKYELNH